eukprot:6747571-Prymnesium_polylepis.1
MIYSRRRERSREGNAAPHRYGITVHHTHTRPYSCVGLCGYGLWCAVRRYRSLRALCGALWHEDRGRRR